jgi:hypothetical protein
VTVSPWAVCENVNAVVEPSNSTFDTLPIVAPPLASALSVIALPFQPKSVA